MEAVAREGMMVLMRGVGGGLLVAAVAYAACRLLPRLTAPVRFWLWWLVAAKLILGLAMAAAGVAALRVPVLSAEHYNRIRRIATRTTVKTVRSVVAHVPKTRAVHPRPAADAESETPMAAVPTIAHAPVAVLSKHPFRAATAIGLRRAYPVAAMLYLIGLVALMAKTAYEWVLVRRLLARARPCADADLCADVVAITERLRLARVPRLLLSSETSVPLVTGFLRPAIVLPEAFAHASPAVRRMALAHEMAHLRRGDLMLAIVPALARALFWFFPVVHYAVRELGLAREESCDIVAVQASGTTTAAYGSLLVSVASRRAKADRFPAIAALSMASATSPGFTQVKRRLKTLQREAGRPVPLVWRGVATTLILAQGAVTLLPLRPALAGAAAAARAALPDTSPLPRYTLTDLGTLGGGQSGAFAINDAGVVVGTANVFPLGGRGHAFLHDGKAIHDLVEASVYRHSVALSVSGTGVVAGAAYRSSYRSGEQTAFVWNGRQRLYLPPMFGYHFARANGVTDAVDLPQGGFAVVGTSLSGGRDDQGATVARATLWKDGTVHDLGTLGGRYSQATAISPGGLIVGKADLPEDGTGARRTHPFVYAGDAMRDLGTLGGANGAACAIGEFTSPIGSTETVVGYAETSSGAMHAFATDPSRSDAPRDLGTINGYTTSAAYGIARSGAIVGQASAPGQPDCALFWRQPNSAPVDLNALLTPDAKATGWQLETARGINAQGQIVGQGTVGGRRHAFLLTPVR